MQCDKFTEPEQNSDFSLLIKITNTILFLCQPVLTITDMYTISHPKKKTLTLENDKRGMCQRLLLAHLKQKSILYNELQ